MIGTSPAEYVFIRACIVFLESILPCSIVYCSLVLITGRRSDWIPTALEVWAVLETLFYLFVFLPRRCYLQAAAKPPDLQPLPERQKLFAQIMLHIKDYEQFLSKWFLGSPISEIKRENMEEWLRWAFLNTAKVDERHQEELDDYILSIEAVLGRTFEGGRGKAKCIRLTVDKVNMLHRSLLWYFCIAFVDTISSLRLYLGGFHYYRAPLGEFFDVFPYRIHNLFSPHVSPSNNLTYWHRPHQSETDLPILFIHGIGVGLYPYAKFLAELNDRSTTKSNVGIIAIEIMSISSRLTGPIPAKAEMCAEVERIVNHHGWKKFVLVSHSYGSIVSTHLLQSPQFSDRIGPSLLLDPVCLLLHLPDVAYNFVYRRPKSANELQLNYFASNDMGISHTLSRSFFWSENILWKEDIAGRDITVSLSGRDCIIDTQTVGSYLADVVDKPGSHESWKSQPWKGQGLDLLWFENLDHAQVLDKKSTRALLVKIARGYSAQG